jgi:hypothetical protein
MCESTEQALVIAIESYAHAPRILSVSEVVRQVASVFPDQDYATLAKRVRKSRQNVTKDHRNRAAAGAQRVS